MRARAKKACEPLRMAGRKRFGYQHSGERERSAVLDRLRAGHACDLEAADVLLSTAGAGRREESVLLVCEIVGLKGRRW